jgi:serine/threonine-protein kinase
MMAALGGTFLLALIAFSSARKSTTLVTPLTYQSSCGSLSSSSGEWWPVLGPAKDDLLENVRSRYCGDAYVNANGYLQVASFNSPSEAEQFVERLSIATGASFRMGERYKP